jgi:hypothetical protein
MGTNLKQDEITFMEKVGFVLNDSYDSSKFIWCEKVLLQSIGLLMQCHGLHHAMVILFDEHSLLRCQNHILTDGKVVISSSCVPTLGGSCTWKWMNIKHLIWCSSQQYAI